MKHIFLSYSRDDYSFIDRLIHEFVSIGQRVWFDRGNIHGGSIWKKQIVKAIDEASSFIIVLSPNSIKSENVRKELDIADELNKKIIPIKIKQVKIPNELRFQLAGVHIIDFTKDFSESLILLYKAIGIKKIGIKVTNDNPVVHDSMKSKIVKRIANTGLSAIYLSRRPNNETFILKRRSKDINSSLDYSQIRLDPTRFAIPDSTWQDDNYIYESIQYYEGWNLAEIVQLNNGGIGGSLIESWALELLELLSELHSHTPPIIHRDLKPENIYVTHSRYQLILLDLTSAVVYFPGSSYDKVGTDGYISPEQLEGNPTLSSDLYSLAATLYKINSGIDPPNIFDRKRGKIDFKLNDISTRLALFYSYIANLNLNKRLPNAMMAIKIWHNCRPGTYHQYNKLKPIKLPNGKEIEQSLGVGGGPTIWPYPESDRIDFKWR